MSNMAKLFLEIEGLFEEGYNHEDIIKQIMEDHDVELDVAARWVAEVESDIAMRDEANYYADEDAEDRAIKSQAGIDIVEGVEYDMDFNYD
jgi:hypothetical protein